jgi:hypothetical protein
MQMRNQNWKPGFVDYLFLAFNTSTAFSSLGTVVVLGARAVNIL